MMVIGPTYCPHLEIASKDIAVWPRPHVARLEDGARGLWRRYLVNDPRIVWRILLQWLGWVK
jgi:hypothetical protein